MGIEDILKKNDAKRAAQNSFRTVADRALTARAALADAAVEGVLAAFRKINDRAIGEPLRLPIASKSTETGIYIECEGLVRLTLHCVIRTDNNGIAYCSTIDLAMHRNGKVVRGSFEPTRGNGLVRPHRLGVPEKQFAVEPAKLQAAVEALARQL